MSNYLLIGPYLGDFRQEIFTFLPHAKGISTVVPHKKVIVSSHFNRECLYTWADKIIPIEPMISIDELNQKNYIYKPFDKREFLNQVRGFKENVVQEFECTKKEIKHYHLNYLKTKVACSYYQLKFDSIEYEEMNNSSDIIFIPDRTEKEYRLNTIFNYISKHYNVSIIGDQKTKLQDENIILHSENYHLNCYKGMIDYISNAKLVICPASHGTFLANLQKVPVFSGGKFIGPYKTGGDYKLNNKDCTVIHSDDYFPTNKILQQLDSVIRRYIC